MCVCVCTHRPRVRPAQALGSRRGVGTAAVTARPRPRPSVNGPGARGDSARGSRRLGANAARSRPCSTRAGRSAAVPRRRRGGEIGTRPSRRPRRAPPTPARPGPPAARRAPPPRAPGAHGPGAPPRPRGGRLGRCVRRGGAEHLSARGPTGGLLTVPPDLTRPKYPRSRALLCGVGARVRACVWVSVVCMCLLSASRRVSGVHMCTREGFSDVTCVPVCLCVGSLWCTYVCVCLVCTYVCVFGSVSVSVGCLCVSTCLYTSDMWTGGVSVSV